MCASEPTRYCLRRLSTIYTIRIVVHHVRGIHDQLSDWISRVLGIEHTDPHNRLTSVDMSSPSLALESLQQWLASIDQPSRRTVCRVLISLAMSTFRDFLQLIYSYGISRMSNSLLLTIGLSALMTLFKSSIQRSGVRKYTYIYRSHHPGR